MPYVPEQYHSGHIHSYQGNTEIINYSIENWDVNNEQLHGQWFEEATGNDFILDHMFEEANRLDPTTPLFLNDYAIVNTGQLLFVSL